MAPTLFGPLSSICSTDRGVLELYEPRPSLFATVMDGFMEKAHARFLMESAQRALIRDDIPLSSFHDWTCMMGYDSQCRLRLTAWMLASPSLFGETHIAVKERLAGMGVEVANLVLSGRIHTHDNTDSLMDALRRELVEYRRRQSQRPPAKEP